MRMLQPRPCGLPVVLKHQDVLEAAVLFQVEDAVAEGPQNIFHPLDRHGGQGFHVGGRLNHYFMRAGPSHRVEHAIRLPVDLTLNSQRGKLVGDYAQVPSSSIPRGVLARTIRHNLSRRLVFVPGTEGTAVSALNTYRLAGKISGTPGAVRGNDDPASGN